MLGAWFGVAPQETILFSGIILANLQAGNPNATLDEVAHACRMTGVHEDTAEAFAKTINQLKGKVTMLFITHALPKSLRVDAVLRIDQGGGHQFQVVPGVPGERGQT